MRSASAQDRTHVFGHRGLRAFGVLLKQNKKRKHQRLAVFEASHCRNIKATQKGFPPLRARRWLYSSFVSKPSLICCHDSKLLMSLHSAAVCTVFINLLVFFFILSYTLKEIITAVAFLFMLEECGRFSLCNSTNNCIKICKTNNQNTCKWTFV